MLGRTAYCGPPLFALIAMGLLASTAQSRIDASDLCLRAASQAAAETGVPYDVLQAIAIVESGRNNRPWPWTANFGGEGRWFDSAAEAEAVIARALDEGATNVDIGCFQLNHRWHAQAFSSVSDMLDPDRNATYAASFLAEHFERTGDWASAAAAYHSLTPEHSTTYQAKFEAALAGLEGDAGQWGPAAPAPARRINGFPLLVAGTTGSRGSLVSPARTGARLVGGP